MQGWASALSSDFLESDPTCSYIQKPEAKSEMFWGSDPPIPKLTSQAKKVSGISYKLEQGTLSIVHIKEG